MTGGLTLSIGEAMVELSQVDDLWSLGVAGDTLNTAWYLRRLLGADWRVGYFSRVGVGGFSDRMVDFLEAEGIESTHVTRDPEREIGLYAISLDGGERSFSYWRETSAARRLADDPAALARGLAGASIAYTSGITLAILPDAGRAALLSALTTARAAGATVVFDPNLRPRLWSDAAAMRRWIEAAGAVSDLVLPSFDDEALHFGDADPQATCRRYCALGAGTAVVKNGGGAVAWRDGVQTGLVTNLPRVAPVDSTAAGDSFNAGFLAARLNGAGIEGAIRAAHDLAQRVVGHRGALVRAAL